MKNNLKKTFLVAGIACAALIATPASGQKVKRGQSMYTNPLMQKSPLPFGAPDFSKIKSEHYLPAIQMGIEEQRAEIKQIVANKQKPTFQNTILAFEKSGELLDRVKNIFYAILQADKTPELEAVEKTVSPMFSNFENEINFNQEFFERVKYVYDHERNSLKGEDKVLLEEIYKNFVRSGALLPEDKMERMEEINNRLAQLQQDFGNLASNLLYINLNLW